MAAMKHISPFRFIIAVGACLVMGCASGPKLQKSAADNGTALNRYFQLYPGPPKEADAVAILAGYSGFDAERRVAVVGRIEKLDTGDTWSVPDGHAIELLPGPYKVFLSGKTGGARWTAEFTAMPNVVYGLAQDGWAEGYERSYPKFVPLAVPDISVSDVRSRNSKEQAQHIQRKLKPNESSRYVQVLAGVSTQSSNRMISIARWEKLTIDKHSQGAVEYYVGPPSRVSKDVIGNDVYEYDGIVYTTEREESKRKYSRDGRTLKLRFGTDGEMAEIMEP